MTVDLGDVVSLSVEVRDPAGVLADAGAVACTVTAPDGSTSSPAVSSPSTGVYVASFAPALAGAHGVRWVATGANASSFSDGFTVLPSSVPLLGLSDVKARLNATSSVNDEELRRVVVAATGRAEAEVGRALASRSVVQVIDLSDRPRPLAVVPTPALLSVSAVTLDGAAVSDFEVAGSGQAVRRTGGGVWDGLVSVSGVVGVAGGELAVAQQAVLELVAHLWETQRAPAGRNPQAPTGMGYALPNRVLEMLEPLRLRGLA